KQKVADFEFDLLKSEKSFSSIAQELFIEGNDEESLFETLLSQIDFKLFAKDVEATNSSDSKGFITNERNAESYNVKRVNYFFDGPTELWLIDVLWTLYVGPILDQKLTKDCYGNRLKGTPLSPIEPSSSNDSKSIFENYITQYNSWRSGAIDTAKRISTEGDDVAILTLDIQQYYYNVDMKFCLIEDEIKAALGDGGQDKLETALLLTRLLERIYKTYHEQITKRLKHTHKECKDNLGLPIGLTSSTVLANWYLAGFDEEVSSIVRPAYYGRYVDDIIFVFKRPHLDQQNPVKSIFKNYFHNIIIVNEDIKVISKGNSLPVQRKKMMLHYFSAEHSIAGLDVVIEAINQQSSEFRLLPDGNSKINLSKFAEEFLYSEDEGQLKNVLKATENEGSLSQFLS
ncbi:RNA-directed DNA polymerase, partial [Pseudoalteromonas sp. Z1A6]